MKPSQTLSNLPPYVFMRLVELKKQARELGKDIIDLGMGNPDVATAEHIRQALKTSIDDPITHRYPLHEGTAAFREGIAAFYRRRFSVTLNPNGEILALLGSKEGLGHLIMAMTDPGDTIIAPSPAYPAHSYAPYLARVKTHWAVLEEKNDWMLDFAAIPEKILRRAKLLILNYPNNPTGAVIKDVAYLKEAVRCAKKYGFLLIYDNAYSEITFDGYVAPSVLEIKDAKKYAVEFNSFSKTYSMAGWRVGYAVGHDKAIGYLRKFKSFLDYGVPEFIQRAAIAALEAGGERDMALMYERRRDTFLSAVLMQVDWAIPKPSGSMYLWARLPKPYQRTGSLRFVQKLLLETGVCLSPGSGFGRHGEGYVRISLVAPEDRLTEAARRIGVFLKSEKPRPLAYAGEV